MQKLLVRSGLTGLYLLADMLSVFLPSGPYFSVLWGVFVAICFAWAVVHFTGRAAAFIAIVTFVVSALLPFLVLCRIGEPAYGAFAASCATVFSSLQHYNFLGAFALVVPVVIATACSLLLPCPPLTIRSSGRL